MSKKHNNRGGNNSKGNKAMKYMVRADIKVNGTVQRKDIIGAIMGQTEGLLGDELELRKLQRTARIGHVDVEMENKGGKVHGLILIPSSLDNVETAIIASSLETVMISSTTSRLKFLGTNPAPMPCQCFLPACMAPLNNTFSGATGVPQTLNVAFI